MSDLKGYLMEEKLRSYFLDMGFFVIRGVKFKYEGFDITDIDLWLYNRPSPISRERLIVDIKNKKTPQAIERIFWTKGLMLALNLNECLVATTEKRESVRQFGRKNGVTVLDGNFLSKLKDPKQERLSEEDFFNLIRAGSDSKFKENWREDFELSKELMLTSMDFSGCNKQLITIKAFLEHCSVNKLRSYAACRILYCVVSHFLLTIDFINQELAFLDVNERANRLSEGFKFGNLGKAGLERTIQLATTLATSGAEVRGNLFKVYDSIPVDILKEYFSRTDIASKLFTQAKAFENLAYSQQFTNPNSIDSELKGVLSILLDFHQINRSRFFSTFINSQLEEKNITGEDESSRYRI